MANVIVTNHVAGSSKKAMINMGVESVQNILTVLRGDRPYRASIINSQVFERSL